MPLGPDPERARAARAQLDALRETVTAAEDDVLACLVVTGEPVPQRVLDDWLDQVADTLRALGETAEGLSTALARFAGSAGLPQPSPDAVGPAALHRGTVGTVGTVVAPVEGSVDAEGLP